MVPTHYYLSDTLLLTGAGKFDINKRRQYWICKCDCGNTCEKQEYLLSSGTTKSCGWQSLFVVSLF